MNAELFIPTGKVVHGMSNASYHASAGVSSSGLRDIRRSPFHFHALRQGLASGTRGKETPSMFAGTLAHCATLEPLEFDSRYVIPPKDWHKASNDFKAWRESLPEGVEPITQAQKDVAFAQARALHALPDVALLMEDGDPEVSAYWQDEGTAVWCKCRPDWVGSVEDGEASLLLDVKTTTDASASGFARACAAWGYHIQAAFYTEGYAFASRKPCRGMVFAVVENEFPYAAATYVIDEAGMVKGRQAVRESLAIYADCVLRDSWPGYPQGIQQISLPAWA